MATDFFQRQQRARAQTAWLRVLFVLALGLAAVLDAVGIVLFANIATMGAAYSDGSHGAIANAFLRTPDGWVIALAVLGLMCAVSAFTAWQHRGGGGVLARALRGTLVTGDTQDPRQRQLLNVVAEMAIAARVPQPEVWVLERDEAINAFAAGRTLEGAVIGITGGALRELDRDELQAVVAHEFSHILNGDMALNTRLVAWLAGLFAIEEFAASLQRDRGTDSRGRRRFFWFDIGIWFFRAAGATGLFIGRALQAAICRRREVLADASAVQFTRNPVALKSALLKIEAVAGTGVARPGGGAAAGMAHMMFAPGALAWRGLLHFVQGIAFSTHPPTMERVRALDRRLTEAQYRAAVREHRRDYLEARQRAAAPVQLGGESLRPATAPTPGPAVVPDLSCSRLNHDQQRQVLALQSKLAESKDSAPAMLVASLLDRRPQQGRAQLVRLAPLLGAALTSRVPAMSAQLGALPDVARLPLVAGLLPHLREQPDRMRLVLVKVLRAFQPQVAAEDTLRFATLRLALRELVQGAPPTPAAPPGDPAPELAQHAGPVGVLLSLLAAQSGELAPKAFRAGLDGLIAPPKRPAMTSAPVPPAAVDAALLQLASLPRPQRLAFSAACVRTLAANRSMGAAEAELLRLYCACLSIPMPPPGVRAEDPGEAPRLAAL